MAAGCAVVGSGVVGVQEVIDPGRNGLLAEPAAVGAPEQVQRRAPDGSHHEGVRVAR